MRYKYAARSGDTNVVGLLQLYYYPTPVQVSRIALERATREVERANESWDPFNCTLVVVRDAGFELISKEQFQNLMEQIFKATQNE